MRPESLESNVLSPSGLKCRPGWNTSGDVHYLSKGAPSVAGNRSPKFFGVTSEQSGVPCAVSTLDLVQWPGA